MVNFGIFDFCSFVCRYLYCIFCFLLRIAVAPLLTCSRCEWLSMLLSVQKWIQLTHVFPSILGQVLPLPQLPLLPLDFRMARALEVHVLQKFFLWWLCWGHVEMKFGTRLFVDAWHAAMESLTLKKMVNSISYPNLGSHRCGRNVEICFIVWGIVNSVVKFMGAPWDFNIHPQKQNLIFFLDVSYKKHGDLDKHQHMTMRFFPCHMKDFQTIFCFVLLRLMGTKSQRTLWPSLVRFPGLMMRHLEADTWGWVMLLDWWKSHNKMIKSIYRPIILTWQWKLDHLKMYFAVNMLIFKPSMLVYRTLQGKLWCKNALMIIVLSQQGGWSVESVRWF